VIQNSLFMLITLKCVPGTNEYTEKYLVKTLAQGNNKNMWWCSR